MENAITFYFKEASYSLDENKRNNLISQGKMHNKGCKKITDSLKDPEEFKFVAEQKSLIKYLIICSPIFGEHISLIIDSTLEFYNKNQTFMLNFWESLNQLGQLDENNNQGQDIDIKSISHIVNMKNLYNSAFCKEI